MTKNDFFKIVSKVPERSTIPALERVYIDKGRFVACDLDVSAHAPATAGFEDGAAYDKKGFQVSTPDTLDVFGAQCRALWGPGDVAPEQSFEIHDLPGLLAKVAHCISPEETRYYLRGVYFGTDKGTLDLCATDGHRMALFETYIHARERVGVIVPHKAVKLIMAFKGGGTWRVKWADHVAEFEEITTGFVVRTKVIDGTFPDYSRIIPKHDTTAPYALAGDATECRKVFEAFTRYGPERNKKVRLEGLALSATSDDLAPLSMVLPADAQGVGINPVGFNPKYLVEAMKAIGKGGFRLQMQDSISPCRITSPEHPELMQVIMPLRV